MLMRFLQATNAYLADIGCTDLFNDDASQTVSLYEVYIAKTKNGQPKSSYPRKPTLSLA